MKAHQIFKRFIFPYFFCLASMATADSSSVYKLEKVTVSAERRNVLAYDKLDSAVLEKPRVSNTADGLLTGLAGVDVKRSAPSAGKGRGVTLRGFDESRYLVLLDGRPLNGSGVMSGDYVDWAALPLDNIEEIRVVRGPKSAEIGNTLGGAIELITKQGKDLPEKTTVSASYGIFSPQHAADAYENRRTLLSFSHRANIGKLAALDVYGSRDKSMPFLRNNYCDVINAGGKFSLFLPLDITAAAGIRNTVQYRGFALANHAGDPYYDNHYPESDEEAGGGPGLAWIGGNYYFGDRSYWKNIRTQMDFSFRKEWRSVLASARLYINDQDRTEYFYAITDTNKLVLERFAKPEDNTRGWNLKVRQALSEKTMLRYGVEGMHLRYSNTDVRGFDTTYFRRSPSDGTDEVVPASDLYSAYTQSELLFFDRLLLTPGLRYDYYLGNQRDSTVSETPLGGAGPNAGASLRTWKGGEVSIHGAYRYRFPTCPELYWYYNGHSFSDRKSLTAERAIQVEAGLSQAISTGDALRSSVGIRGYRYLVRDYIRTIFGGRPVSSMIAKASRLVYNIDNVVLNGLEAEAEVSWRDRLRMRANYTWQITRKTGDIYDSSTTYSDGLPELPNHKTNAALEYGWENGSSAGLSMRYVGSREVLQESFSVSGAAYEKVDAFTTVRLFGVYPIPGPKTFSAKLKLGVDNLLNTEYEEEPGIPMPGLTITGAVDIYF